MMIQNGEELERATGGFTISRTDTYSTPASIIDFCMASGAFLHLALRTNSNARALAFTLPVTDGGHTV